MKILSNIKNKKTRFLEFIIIISISIFFSYLTTFNFLFGGNSFIRTAGWIFFIAYLLLFIFYLTTYILKFSFYSIKLIFNEKELNKLRNKIILAYIPFILSAFIIVYLMIKSSILYNLALQDKIDFSDSKLINRGSLPIIALVSFIVVFLYQTYLINKYEKVLFLKSILISITLTLSSAILFNISSKFLELIFYLFMALFMNRY